MIVAHKKMVMITVNNETDVLFVQKASGLISTTAHDLFVNLYQTKVDNRLARESSKEN